MQGTNGVKMAISDQELRQRLELLKIEHRDLDEAIAAMVAADNHDQLRGARLKKRKLNLRDRIIQIENQLIPDSIA